MRMYNPPHPGEVLKELCIEPLNLTVTEVALALGVIPNPEMNATNPGEPPPILGEPELESVSCPPRIGG